MALLLAAQLSGPATLHADEDDAAAAPTSAGTGATPAGGSTTYIADLGFRPAANGFKFANYTNRQGYTNLTANEMQRLFGNSVCAKQAGTTAGCVLTPQAKKLMESTNAKMAGGHCEGFAVLSLLFYNGTLTPSLFGGASAGDLAIESNNALQRELAFWWAMQTNGTVANNKSSWATKSPNDVLATLTPALRSGPSGETYTLTMRNATGTAGHAVTPYALVDKGNGITGIMVYDNNYPGDATRVVDVDTKANTWKYSLSLNPDAASALWQGTATSGSLRLGANTVRLAQQQAWPFGLPGKSATGGGAAMNRLSVTGGAHLLITDPAGRRLGFVGDRFVQDIPGASILDMDSAEPWTNDYDPEYLVPAGVPVTVTVDGSTLAEAATPSVYVIGAGYDLTIEGFSLAPGEKDSFTVSGDGRRISYTTQGAETPTFTYGVETQGPAWEFLVQGMTMQAGSTLTMAMDVPAGKLTLLSVGGSGASTYSLAVSRSTEEDDLAFRHDGIELKTGDRAELAWGAWKANGTPMQLGVDAGNKGSFDQTLDLSDDD